MAKKKQFFRRAVAIVTTAALTLGLTLGGVAFPNTVYADEDDDEEEEEAETVLVPSASTYVYNTVFEDNFTSLEGWTVSGSVSTSKIFTYSGDAWVAALCTDNQGTTGYNYWNSDAVEYTVTQTIDSLSAGTYKVTADALGASCDITVMVGDYTETLSPSGSAWEDIEYTFTISENLINVTVGFDLDLSVGGWGYIDSLTIESVEVVTIQDAFFEDSDIWGNNYAWTFDPSTWGYTNDSSTWVDTTWITHNTSYYGSSDTGASLSICMSNNGDTTVVSQTLASLPAGTYTLGTEIMGANASVVMYIKSGETEYKSDAVTTQGWDTWVEATSEFTIENALTDVEIGLSITFTPSSGETGYVYIDYLAFMVEEVVTVTKDTSSYVDADVYVDAIDLDDDFITGVDVSSLKSEYDSGVVYKTQEGEELEDMDAFFDYLAECGVNYVRIRVWNDPTNSTTGLTYGGGANDLATAKEIGKAATDAGLQVLIDFHYSDFWADPGKQTVPKAWAKLTTTDKATALYNFTYAALKELYEAGVDVGMVQIGNETNGAFCGETDWSSMCELFNAGSKAVRYFEENIVNDGEELEEGEEHDILVALHFTNPNTSGRYSSYAKYLNTYNVDYDVFASSYYPYWHGTISNLTTVLSTIASTYDKYVMVAETSWLNTYVDTDGHTNTINEETTGIDIPYDISVQGQCDEIYEVVNAVASIDNGIGVFYWEPAWITVGDVSAATTDEEYAAIYAANQTIWETYGSGWATSAAGEYDSSAVTWYGGSAVDDEAWFGADGVALETVNIYNYIRTGAITDLAVLSVTVDDITVEIDQVDTIELPTTATVDYNYGSDDTVDVTWNESDLEAAIAAGVGTYELVGTAYVDEEAYEVVLKLTINPVNLLSNPGFEDGATAWTLTTDDSSNVYMGTESSNKRTGTKCFKYWISSSYSTQQTSSIAQTVTLEAGTYTFGGYAQGGDYADGDTTYIYVTIGDDTTTAEASITEWQTWSCPTITFTLTETTEVTVGVVVTASPGAWGSWDDMYLYKTADAEEEDAEETTTEATTEATTEETTTEETTTEVAAAAVGTVITVGNCTYKVTAVGDVNEVEITGTTSTAAKITLAATITDENGVTYRVTSIAANAFKGNKTMTTVKLSKYIVTIGTKAFANCKKLKTVKLDTALKTIKASAFAKCKKLTKITIPKNVTSIGKKAFFKCTSLKTVVIGKSVKKIGKKAFYGCKKLTKVTIKTKKLTAKTVGAKAFAKCSKLKTVKVPKKKKAAYKKWLNKKGVRKAAKIK